MGYALQGLFKKDARNQSLYPVCSQVQMCGCYEVLVPGMERHRYSRVPIEVDL